MHIKVYLWPSSNCIKFYIHFSKNDFAQYSDIKIFLYSSHRLSGEGFEINITMQGSLFCHFFILLNLERKTPYTVATHWYFSKKSKKKPNDVLQCKDSKSPFPLMVQKSRIQNTWYRIQDTGYRIKDTGYRIKDKGYT